MASLRMTVMRLVGDLVRDEIRRGAMAAMLWFLAFLLLLVAIGFAIGGVYSAIEAPLGPVAASFIVGGGALVLGLLLVFIANRSLRRGREVRREAIDEFADDHPRAADLGDIVGAFAIGLAQGLAKRRKR